MRKVSGLLGPVSSALAIMAGLGMSSVSMAAPTVTLNNTACGSYSAVKFDASGNVVITGEFNCLGSTGGSDGSTGGSDGSTGGGDGSAGGSDGSTGGGDGSVGGSDGSTGGGDGSTGEDKIPEGVVFIDQPWSNNIASNVRDPIRLKSGQKYTIKMNKPLNPNVKGYGNIVHINTTNKYGVRTAVISEELGSMVPVADGGTFRGQSLCSTVGIEGVINWAYDTQYPRGLYCRLDPTKQYYINIAHQDSTGKNTCTSGLCEFSPSYNKLGDLK